MDGWMDGWMDGNIYIYIEREREIYIYIYIDIMAINLSLNVVLLPDHPLPNFGFAQNCCTQWDPVGSPQ